MKTYYDADGAIVGRLGSIVCKDLLKGKEVVIINSEKAIISGDKAGVVDKISWRKNLGARSQKGPKVSRMCDRMLKRMIRGMLPWDRPKGRDAYDRLKCYIGNGELKNEELKNVQKLNNKLPIKYISLEEACKLI